MDNFEAYLSKVVTEARDYVAEQLMEKYPSINFTIKYNLFNSNTLAFVVHDSDVFFNNTFQQWAFIELPRDYLFPKKILNIIFMYEKP